MADTDTAWLDAITLAPGKIGGVQVLPLTAWHCHAMQMLGVRFGFDGEGRGPTAGEVATAIAICRSRWHVSQIGVPCPSGWLIVWLWLRWIFVDWRRDGLALLLHVSRYSRVPDKEADKGKYTTLEIGAPPYLSIAVGVAREIPGVTLTMAMNMSLVLLNCLRAIVAEREGSITCSWNRTAGTAADEIADGLKQAQQAIDRMQAKKEATANGCDTQSG